MSGNKRYIVEENDGGGDPDIATPSPTASTPQKQRKKRHTYGVYPCDYCSKVFQRSDHLSRHKLTHNSSIKNYVCSWLGCGKKFNRTDTLKLHYNRHLKNLGHLAAATPNTSSSSTEVPLSMVQHPRTTSQSLSSNNGFKSPLSVLISSPESYNTSPSANIPEPPIRGGYLRSNFDNSFNNNNMRLQTSTGSKETTPLSSGFGLNDMTSPGSRGKPVDQQFNNSKPLSGPLIPVIPSSQTQQQKSFIASDVMSPTMELTTSSSDNINMPSVTDNKINYLEPFLQPSDILSILFPEEVSTSQPNYVEEDKFDNILGSYTSRNFEFNSNVEQDFHDLFDHSGKSILNNVTGFPLYSKNLIKPMGLETLIDREVIQKMLQQIPNLAFNSDFHELLLQRALEIFWGLYNRRLSIIHKPSFNPKKAPAVLLLAMIMIGAAMTRCTDQTETIFINPQKLAEDIAVPLRWVIFQSPDVMTPKTYIIQSLIILENFEKHLSSRELFQRSTIHQSAKVQILRRSTTLGGAPYRKDNFEAESLWGATNKSTQIWDKWIELESMKRSAYLTFVIDSYSALLTCQEIAVYAHQLKLSLPCDEDLWLTLNFEEEYLKTYEWKTESFLSAFVDMMNEKSTSDSYASSGLLFSGIVTLIFLFQNTTSMKFINSVVNESWKKVLAYALESWLVNVRGNCCKVPIMKQNEEVTYGLEATSIYNSPNDHRCKMPLYHLAHVLLRLSSFDWMTYCGSPSLKNIRADFTDYKSVSNRIRRWATSKEGGICLVNAYLLIIECFLSNKGEVNFVPYLPERDVFFERPHCVGQLVIIAWSYSFCLGGAESAFLDSEMNYNYYMNDSSYIDMHVKEDGYAYLERVRDAFNKTDEKFDQMKNELQDQIPSSSSEATRRTQLYHKKIEMYAETLKNLENLHHIAGLMLVAAGMYSKCVNLELCFELSRLMKHCQSRSMGNMELKCTNMYRI